MRQLDGSPTMSRVYADVHFEVHIRPSGHLHFPGTVCCICFEYRLFPTESVKGEQICVFAQDGRESGLEATFGPSSGWTDYLPPLPLPTRTFVGDVDQKRAKIEQKRCIMDAKRKRGGTKQRQTRQNAACRLCLKCFALQESDAKRWSKVGRRTDASICRRGSLADSTFVSRNLIVGRRSKEAP